jgi:lipoprotein-anchoring transpeptidase ErfK/SrfK
MMRAHNTSPAQLFKVFFRRSDLTCHNAMQSGRIDTGLSQWLETRPLMNTAVRHLVLLAGAACAAGCAGIPGMASRIGGGEHIPPAVIVLPATTGAVVRATPPAPRPPSPASASPAPPAPTQTPAPVPTPAEPLSFRAALALQTLLDRRHFSSGCLDGVIGGRTREALSAWQAANGLPATGEPDQACWDRLGNTEGTLTTHTVTSNEVAALTPPAATWRERAAAERLGYVTVLETIAERYHASEGCIRRLNPDVAWPDPPEGTAVVVPNPYPTARLPAAGGIRIFLGRKVLQVLDHRDVVVAHFPCSIGRDFTKRPVGQFEVKAGAPNPNYMYDPAVFPEEPESATISSILLIPPGPNNPVGTAWIGLSLPGYGIHGTPRPEDIGKTESHGCFRLTNWNAEKLLKMVTVGTPLTIEP